MTLRGTWRGSIGRWAHRSGSQSEGPARAARRTITQNVVIAMGVIAVLVPLAAFGGIGLGGAVVLHEGSTVAVVLNGLRLLAWRDRGAPR